MLCYIGVGSNLGDRAANIEKVVSLLNERAGLSVKRRSPVYETEPEGGPAGQSRYLNLVLELDCSTGAEELIDILKDIERSVGRKPASERWSAREIDLDILLCSDLIVETDNLKIPHPLMHKRIFVLKPLCDLAPEAKHPVLGLKVRDMLEALEESRI